MALDEFGDLFGGDDIVLPIDIPDSPLPGLVGEGFDPNLFGGGGFDFGDFFNFGGDSGGGGDAGVNTANSLLTALGGGRGILQGGIGALGIGTGLAGLIQALMAGQPGTTTSRKLTAGEQQLTQQTATALQNLRGLAQNAQLNQAVSRMAAGQLPISPDLVGQVTSAFGGVAGDLAQGAIDNARMRGFSGGSNLLAKAGSPQYAQSLARLQSDVSNALVNLAVGLPQTASNIQSQQIQANAVPIGMQNDLLRMMQTQGTVNTQQTGGSSLFNALGPFTQTLGATGGLLAGLNGFNQPNPYQPVQQQMTRLSG